MNWVKKIWHKTWDWIKPYLTVKMLPIVLTIWVFTNGVWYFIAFVNVGFPVWLMTFAKAYLIFLYMPFTAEKVVIIALSLLIYRLIYKEKFNHKKEENVLEKESDIDGS